MFVFSQLLKQFNQQHSTIELPDEWRQGRTTYGGLSAALMLSEVLDTYADIAPLRSAQINFIGPASGHLEAQHTILRQGKNSLVIESRLMAEGILAASAIFIFAASRQSQLALQYPCLNNIKSPEDCGVFVADGQGPAFLEHFDRYLVAGNKPFSQSDQADFTLWMRHRDHTAQGIVALVAIADAPPPATMACADRLVPLSTMNWHISLLQDEPKTTDGWWLIRSQSQHLDKGYCAQNITLWNSEGERVIDAIQHIAIFD